MDCRRLISNAAGEAARADSLEVAEPEDGNVCLGG
jgi:hypothetical protein